MTTTDPQSFRDLNKNGRLDPYEDPRQPIDARIADLIGNMSLAEKAGLMFHTMAGVPGPRGGPPSLAAAEQLLDSRGMSHFNVHQLPPPREAAEWHNDLQAHAGVTRLGIPITVSSDPRHSFQRNVLTSAAAGAFSLWPEPIGLAALGDPALVEEFANMARQEYVAVGIRVALHPMADLATEPRWGRIGGTFGEDAELAARLIAAYVRGFQGPSLGPTSVACMTKHFPGGGPQKDGEDPHFAYGKEQIYPGGNFDYHLVPFQAAFAAGTAQIMPYYGVPVGVGLEEVGFAFNRKVITGLLRGKYGFDGVVCTDWALLTDHTLGGELMEARAWGVEHLSVEERALKALDAGVDQFGGEACPEVLVRLVEGGRLPEARLDVSVRRLLRDKFRLGLFDDPYVDPDAAERVVGNPRFRAAGELAQRRSLVLLKNSAGESGRLLPLRGRPRLYVEGVAPESARAYGEVVASPEQADVAILRLGAPFEAREGFFRFIHSGSLSFPEDEKRRVLAVLRAVPTVVDVYLERPAVVPEIAAECAALLGSFGSSDEALLDVVFGKESPAGRLPFELPSSDEAVLRQAPDLPRDSANPLYPFGFGLSY